MADKKKTNLPTEILSGPEMNRRKFLGGATSLIGQAALDMPTGRIIDAIGGEGGLSSLGDPKEKQLLIKLAQLNRSIRQIINDAELSKDFRNQNKSTWIDLFRDPEAYTEGLGEIASEEYIAYHGYGDQDPETYVEHQERMAKIGQTQDEVRPKQKEYADTLWELAELHRKKYPKEVVDKWYKLPATSGNNTDPVTGKISLEQDTYSTNLPFLINEISQAISVNEDYPDMLPDSSLDEEISRVIEDRLPPLQLEAPEDKIEDRIKKIAGAVGTQALSRALTQLAEPKDPKQKQIQKAKGPKQRAGPKETEKPSINKLLSALSIFKKGTPLGAAAYAMGPTEAGRGSDIVPEDPYEDTWVDSAGNIHLK